MRSLLPPIKIAKTIKVPRSAPILELPEDSWVLRLLAQLMVIVGILATDMAAETTMSLWAVPASMAGASWSWYNRRKRNIAVKFLLAIGMILALIMFFGSLLVGRELNDTRLALAELLIQIQVLHSFDLPRRKDLGYSMMIGLILIGVACTLSQTMGFGLWLLLFLAIALPVLIMDYRARLGLPRWADLGKVVAKTNRKSWNGLPKIFALIVALGLVIFAVMPRLPGYQIQTFPMSAPIETQGKFDERQITNPGYIGQGRGQGDGVRPGRGTSPLKGPGQADDTFYAGFGTQINQNLRGRLKEQVVMRVRSQAEGFWRVMAFDQYTGQGWEISENEKTQTLKRSSWSYQFFLQPTVWLSRTKQVIQTFTMVGDLPNVIPALYQPKELYFPTQEVALDKERGLRSPTPLTAGLTYTVVSEVPFRDRVKLQKAISQLPNGSKTTPYTAVPTAIQPKVKQLAVELLKQANSPITSDYEKALFLAQALKQRYRILPEMPFLDEKEDLVEAFLFKYKGGYPDHFSTVLTVMLRSLGMTTRLVTGFAPGQFNPFTGYYVVKNTDAYAMTEVLFNKHGWFAFDPIPGHPLIPPSVEESQTFTVLKQFWKWVAGWLPSPVSAWLNWAIGGLMTAVFGAIGQIFGLFRQGWFGVLTVTLVLLVLGWLGWMLWSVWGRWRYWQRLQGLHPVERLYQQMVDWLAQEGWRKHPAQTPGEYLQRLEQQRISPQMQVVVRSITQEYLAWRYAGRSGGDVVELRRSLRQVRRDWAWEKFRWDNLRGEICGGG
jgi:transglutaminase-like putative cysteine protease